MKLEKKEITQKFQRSLHDISIRLIDSYALKYEKKIANLNSPLLRWMDFRLRYIEPFPRQIAFSDKFPNLSLPEDAKRALNHFTNLILKGSDINPYQSRGLIIRNDTSGEDRGKRTDLLWATCDIFHFHLSDKPIPSNQFFSLPADYLAFCLVGGNIIAFIDVLPHPDRKGFSNIALIETICRSWPHYFEGKRLRGISADVHPKTNDELHVLRESGINSCININGGAYMPGAGITSAGTALDVTLRHNYINRCVQQIAAEICISDNQFLRRIQALGVSNPNFTLEVTERGLTIYESESKVAFLLPRPKEGEKNNHYANLHELFLPKWALQKLSYV